MNLFNAIFMLIVTFGVNVYPMEDLVKSDVTSKNSAIEKENLLRKLKENYEHYLATRRLRRKGKAQPNDPNVVQAKKKIQENLLTSIELGLAPLKTITYAEIPISLAKISIVIDYPNYIDQYNRLYPKYFISLSSYQKEELLQAIADKKKITKKQQ